MVHKLKYLIREIRPEARLEGHNEDFDKAVHLAAYRLLEPEIFGLEDNYPSDDVPEQLQKTYDELNDQFSANKKEVDSIVQDVAEELPIRQVLRDYWLVKHFVKSMAKNSSSAEYNLSRATSLDTEATPLTNKDVASMRRSVKKDIANLRGTIADRQALKINITAPEIAVMISVASSLFLVTGYLYNFLLLSEFGADVSSFFTLSDYIAASISKSSYVFVSAFVTTIVYFMGIHHTSRRSEAQLRYEQSRPVYWTWRYLFVLMLFVSAIVGYFLNIRQFYNSAQYAAIFLSMLVLPDVCRRYFRKPLPALCVLVFVVCFFTMMWASLGRTLDDIRYGDLSRIYIYEVNINDSLSLETSDLVLLTANSGFLFFLDQNRKLYILNKDQVDFLEQKNAETGSDGLILFPQRKKLDKSPQ